jgi:excisionase family DNA binding protein
VQKKQNRSSFPNHRYLSVPEAAEYLGISIRSIRRHVTNGELVHHRVGWLIKFLQSELDDFARRFGGPG